MERPTVAIFSGARALSLSIVENLLANFCEVLIFTKEKERWNEITAHAKGTSRLEILEEERIEDFPFDYLIFIDLDGGRELPRHLNMKTLIILPYSELSKSERKSVDENTAIIYVGDLLGPRMDLAGPSELSRVIFDALSKRKIGIKKEEYLYPVFIPDVSRLVVRWLFSFGPYGEKIAVVSKQISFFELYNVLRKYLPGLTFTEKRQTESRTLPFPIRRHTVPINLDLALRETLIWFTRYQPQKSWEATEKKPPMKIGVKRQPKLFLRVVPAVLLVLILSFPFLMTLTSLASLFFTKWVVASGNLSWAGPALVLAQNSASAAKEESLILSNIPLAGKIYGPNIYFSSLIIKLVGIGSHALYAFNLTGLIATKVFGDEVYDVSTYSEKLSLEFDYLYKEISFLEGEKTTISLFNNINLDKLRELALNGKSLAVALPEILGEARPVTYLVLLQNNTELRPTGGFIGSFALVTLDRGRLVDISVQDVYSADGQLRGHVEPPPPIKNYLGEAGWYLRDSNWDPDFPTTAGKVEWFLDKEIDKSVDGVVAVDLELVKTLLKEMGPINLRDFNVEINYKNIYEKTQGEVQSNFFPGSRKKATFLTALTRELLTKITKLDKKEYLPVAKSVFSSLDERHIQVFLHNKNGAEAFSNLGWDGEVATPTCDGNCFSDWLGIIEANVGVNKANYFIKRKADLSVSLEPGVVRKRLSLSLENSANSALGLSGKYKVYVRLLAPEQAEFSDITITSGVTQESLTPEITELKGRKEAGFLLEVGAGQKKKVTVEWEEREGLSFEKQGEYRLYWRKQAGTDADSVSVNLNFPSGLVVKGDRQYTTTLARDFFSRVSW